jgi:hypothetical protein
VVCQTAACQTQPRTAFTPRSWLPSSSGGDCLACRTDDRVRCQLLHPNRVAPTSARHPSPARVWERLVRKGGVEPPIAFRLPDPKSGASASSATFASDSQLRVTRPSARTRPPYVAGFHLQCYHPRPNPPTIIIIMTASLGPAESSGRPDLYHGVFLLHKAGDGPSRVTRPESGPMTVPCPTTGRLLRVATIEANTTAICPACTARGHGGFITFVGDLRMAYACPECRRLVWAAGA